VRSDDIGEVIEFYVSREEADAELENVLEDEPEWAGEIAVVAIEFPLSMQ
jgi:hypothetical protein